MCDTLCALPSWSNSQATLFAKNSDRSPNEPHCVIRASEKNYAANSMVKLTYLTIPQVEHTLQVILCKPSWTWGAEMGVNSAAVAIGNEAVFTKSTRGPAALTGMDLVRLALERSQSAAQAVTVITTLLETYGQGGNCGFDHDFYYDNSFEIADPHEGYIVETSGKRWAVEKVKDYRAISNGLTIHKEHSMCGGVEADCDFAGKLTEPLYTHFSGSKNRLDSSYCSLERPVDITKMMAALRQHAPKDDAKVFTHGSVISVCMHAGGLVGDHTTGSLIATLREGKPSTLWITGSSTPCISTFKPVFFGVDSGAPVFHDESESKVYWLEREMIHRGLLADKIDITALRNQRDALESRWIAKERELLAADTPDMQALNDFARQAAQEEQKMVLEFTKQETPNMPLMGRFNHYWQQKNDLLERV